MMHGPINIRFTLNILLFTKKRHNFKEQHSKSHDVLTAVSNEFTVFKCDGVYFATMLSSDVSESVTSKFRKKKRVYFSTLNMKAPGFEER